MPTGKSDMPSALVGMSPKEKNKSVHTIQFLENQRTAIPWMRFNG